MYKYNINKWKNVTHQTKQDIKGAILMNKLENQTYSFCIL